jgi:hypothetical protein
MVAIQKQMYVLIVALPWHILISNGHVHDVGRWYTMPMANIVDEEGLMDSRHLRRRK